MRFFSTAFVGLFFALACRADAAPIPGQRRTSWVETRAMSPEMFTALAAVAPLVSQKSQLGHLSKFADVDLSAISPGFLSALGVVAAHLPDDFATKIDLAQSVRNSPGGRFILKDIESVFQEAFASARYRVEEAVQDRNLQLRQDFEQGRISSAQLRAELEGLAPYLIYGERVSNTFASLHAAVQAAQVSKAGEIAAALTATNNGPRDSTIVEVVRPSRTRGRYKYDVTPLPVAPAPQYAGDVPSWFSGMESLAGSLTPPRHSATAKPVAGLFAKHWSGLYNDEFWNVSSLGAFAQTLSGQIQMVSIPAALGSTLLRVQFAGQKIDFRVPNTRRELPLGKEQRLDVAPSEKSGPASFIYTPHRDKQGFVYITGRVVTSRASSSGDVFTTQGHTLRFFAAPSIVNPGASGMTFYGIDVKSPPLIFLGNMTRGFPLSQISRNRPLIGARLAELLSQRRLPRVSDVRFVVLNGKPLDGDGRRYINDNPLTIVVLGPGYSNSGEIFSAGPIVVLDLTSTIHVRSLQQVIVAGPSRLRGSISAQILDVDPHADVSQAAIDPRTKIRIFGQ